MGVMEGKREKKERRKKKGRKTLRLNSLRLPGFPSSLWLGFWSTFLWWLPWLQWCAFSKILPWHQTLSPTLLRCAGVADRGQRSQGSEWNIHEHHPKIEPFFMMVAASMEHYGVWISTLECWTSHCNLWDQWFFPKLRKLKWLIES